MKISAITFGILCSLFIKIGFAQTCTGSLGDPVVKIDFGSGSSTIGPALASGTTTYKYVTNRPNDGEYTIASSSGGMYGTWFSTPDHTGNPGGYMMVVNASYATTDVFYSQTITGLCPGTTYEFAVWVLNLNNNTDPLTKNFSLPNLTFSVTAADGVTPLATPRNTGNIPQTNTPTWVQYALTFSTSPTQNTVIVKIGNNAPGGAGNDLALDDITFRPCGPTIIGGFGSSVVSSYTNCSDNPQKDTLTASVSSGYTNPAFQWQINNGSGWTNIAGATATTYIFDQPAAPGTYQYRMTSGEAANMGNSSCLVTSNINTLTVTQNPTASATASASTICEGSTLTLTAGGGTSYSWTNPAGVKFSTMQNPVITNITPAQAGKYTVTAYLNGCTNQASVTVAVQPKITATVSPNVTICQGSSTTLQASGGLSYLWSPATGLSDPSSATPVASPADTTTYTVTAINNSCSSTASVTVNVIKDPVISAGGNKTVIAGQSVKLNGTANGTGKLTYSWTPTTFLSDPTSLTPTATPTTNITYTLHVSSSPCNQTVIDTAQVLVFVKVDVPNVFSPNGDSINDKWEISGLAIYTSSVLCIYTRNGQMIYTTTGYSKPWDGSYNGKILPEGVYYYTIDLKNGSPMLSGYVTILR